MLVYLAAPLVLGIIVIIFWKLMGIVMKKRFGKIYKRNGIATLLILIYLFYPLVTTAAFQGFKCIEIEEKKVLLNDFSVECWSSKHL